MLTKVFTDSDGEEVFEQDGVWLCSIPYRDEYIYGFATREDAQFIRNIIDDVDRLSAAMAASD